MFIIWSISESEPENMSLIQFNSVIKINLIVNNNLPHSLQYSNYDGNFFILDRENNLRNEDEHDDE